jgi:hypothetical protein
MAAEFRKGTAQLRLENDDQRDGEEYRDAPQQPPDDLEIQKLRDEGEG